MSYIQRLIAVCLAVFMLAGCEKDPERIEVSSISFDQTEFELEPRGTVVLKLTVSPENADYESVVWTSDNAGVATVDNGTVTAVAKGTATVSATVEGKSATCRITVKTKVADVKLSHSEVTLEIGGTVSLAATVSPEDAEYSGIVWESDNASVATVDEAGVVTSVAEGTANVSAKVGDKSASCKVTVVKAAVIYATGYDSRLEVAFRWTLGDNSATILSDDPNQATMAYDIMLKGDDVYIGGTARNADAFKIPTVWKNGQPQALMDVSKPFDGEVYSVCASGDDIFAAGYYRVNRSATTEFRRDAAVVWKNGNQKDLTDGTRYAGANSVTADGGIVYVGGFVYGEKGYPVATLWTSKDGGDNYTGKAYSDGNSYSQIEDVCVSGSDVYMVGYRMLDKETQAVFWKNGELTVLDEGRSYAYSLTVAEGHVYAVGYTTKTYEKGECSVATLWVDGEAQTLTDIQKSSQAWDVVVKNGTVYVSGYIGGQPVIWRNGKAGAIRHDNFDSSCVTAIYVR